MHLKSKRAPNPSSVPSFRTINQLARHYDRLRTLEFGSIKPEVLMKLLADSAASRLLVGST